MDPALYYKTFRPYIRFFENVVYEGVNEAPLDYRGETGAQSTIMPTLIAVRLTSLAEAPDSTRSRTSSLIGITSYSATRPR